MMLQGDVMLESSLRLVGSLLS